MGIRAVKQAVFKDKKKKTYHNREEAVLPFCVTVLLYFISNSDVSLRRHRKRFILPEISVIRFAFIISKIKHDNDIEGRTQKVL